MVTQNAEFGTYIKKSAAFAQPIMNHLRGLVQVTCPKVVEEIKWGIPHFDYAGEMLCIMAAHKSHCSFTFWKQELMKDARLKSNLALPAAKRYLGKITSLDDLPSDKELISFIKEAMILNERGVKLPQHKSERPKEIAIPDYFSKSLASKPKAKSVFESKSDSFRKEYLLWITDAKTEATRQKRIEDALEWIAAGKGRFWQYQKR